MTAYHSLNTRELAELIHTWQTQPDPQRDAALYAEAHQVRMLHYGTDVFVRGLVEVSSYCKQDCLYCGLRKSNPRAGRYRLTPGQILACCQNGASLGFHSFVLQGGEDDFFTDALLCRMIQNIKQEVPGCAITLSLGERSKESARALYAAGADRYLLRHETANAEHFTQLHGPRQLAKSRQECLYNLMEAGFQTGAGFMVGSPGQTPQTLVEDLAFIKQLSPHMVGIGPFIPHRDTPFKDKAAGTLTQTLQMLALTRLLLPHAMMPSTTALGTIHPEGREQGLLAGGNVVMPNLSPPEVRGNYSIYNNKINTGAESGEGLAALRRRITGIGLTPNFSRGDHCSASAQNLAYM